jgi:hypothetical protein
MFRGIVQFHPNGIVQAGDQLAGSSGQESCQFLRKFGNILLRHAKQKLALPLEVNVD